MKTAIKTVCTGTITGIQDLLTDLATFIPDCDAFQTMFDRTGLATMKLEVIADNATISEILEVIDTCEVGQIENVISPFHL
jgi:hypothetical protein